MAAGNEVSTTYYIQHHLQNLTFGNHPQNGWSLAHSAEEASEMGFWAIHLDTMGWSIAMGLLFIWIFRKAEKWPLPACRQDCKMRLKWCLNLSRT